LSVAGLAAWLLALWLLPQPALLDRSLTRASALERGAAIARELGLPTTGLYGAAYADTTLLGLDAEYLRDHPGASPIGPTVATEGKRASWQVRFSQWDRDDTLSLWFDAQGQLIAFDRGLPEDAPGAAISQARARQMATELLARQEFDLPGAALVESSTITRTNRVDHRFVWQSQRVVGEAAHPRVLVAVQGDQVATLSPYLYTPAEYRRERDRTTIISMLERDTLPLLPEVAALLLIGAGLALATRHPPPLRLIVAAGMASASQALLGGLLRLDAAQLAQPPRLLQGATYALYAAILAGADMALIAGGAAMLWSRAFPAYPAIESQAGVGQAVTSGAGVDGKAISFRLFGRLAAWRFGRLLWSDGCRLGLVLLPALLAFGALRAGLSALPGAVRSSGALNSFVPAASVLIDGALSALRAALILAGSAALLASWRPLRPAALPVITLGLVLVAARPDRLVLLGLALLAWPVAMVLARWLRGNLVAVLLALWWAACLPSALALFALDQWWYATNGALAIVVLIAPILLLRGSNR
jgi:hypothetical protein